MKQKVIQIGSSVGITMSKETLEELGVNVGDFVETTAANHTLTVTPQVKPATENAELVAWAEEAVERYRPALEALKDK